MSATGHHAVAAHLRNRNTVSAGLLLFQDKSTGRSATHTDNGVVISKTTPQRRTGPAQQQQQTPSPSAPRIRTGSAQDRDEFCYILRSCSKRMVDNVECTLGRNNFLDVKYFVPNVQECRQHCQVLQGINDFGTSKRASAR